LKVHEIGVGGWEDYVEVCVVDSYTKVNCLWGMYLMTLMNTFKLNHGRGWNPSSLLF